MKDLPENLWKYFAVAAVALPIIITIVFLVKSNVENTKTTAPLAPPATTPPALPPPAPPLSAPPLAPTLPSQSQSSPPTPSPAPEPGAPVVVPAPKAQPVAGFPRELILDNAANVVASNAVKYADGRTQYSVKLSSSRSMTNLFDAYKSYFNSNGWLIAKTATSTNSSSITARKGENSGITVDILAAKNGSDLLINYLTK